MYDLSAAEWRLAAPMRWVFGGGRALAHKAAGDPHRKTGPRRELVCHASNFKVEWSEDKNNVGQHAYNDECR